VQLHPELIASMRHTGARSDCYSVMYGREFLFRQFVHARTIYEVLIA
jgi:hypothetical protein